MERGLPRRLGVWAAGAVVVNSMIGSGIFRVPGAVASNTGDAALMMLAWVAGGVVAVCGALALAEPAALFPRAGGLYVYLFEAYGPLPAFLFGWLTFLIIPAGLAAVALVFAEYLGRLIPLTPGQVRLVAAAALVLLAASNYRSVRLGAALQRLSSALKLAAILVLTTGALLFGNGGAGGVAPTAATALPGGVWGGLGLAIVAVLWACNGWQDATVLAGEVHEPGRTMPRALIGGTLTVTAVYLAANAGYLQVLGVAGVAASPLVAADTAVALVGRVGAALVAALVCVSTFGTLSATTMTQPRICYAMARDGLFFHRVAAVHPRYDTPHVAIALFAGIGLVYLSFRDFEQLIEVFVLGNLPFWALAAGAVPVLRRRRPDLVRPYNTPGYPWVPAVFIAATLALLGNSLREHPESAGATLGLLLLGVPVYLWWARRRAQRPVAAG